MKKILVFLVLSTLGSQSFAQQFAPGFSIALPDSIKKSKVEWVDLDNDGLLDILLIATNADDEHYFMFAKGDTVNTPVLRSQTTSTIAISAYVLADYDRDNAMDLVASGIKAGNPVTVVYRNIGNYAFAEEVLNMPPFTKAVFADLNNDARREWIMSGGADNDGFLSIYSQETTGDWIHMVDTMQMKTTAIEVVDVDNNGVHDLFVSGRVSADSLYTGFLFNQGDSVFIPRHAKEWIGIASTADINTDGQFDVVFLGEDENGVRMNKVFTSGVGTYTITNESLSLLSSNVFLADMNSDGIVDYSFFGKNASGDTLHLMRYSSSDFDTLDTHKVSAFSIGDREHDGDLDVLQVVGTTALELRFVENTTGKNLAPTRPPETVAARIYDRLFVYWEKSVDDHTPVKSLTYDLYFQSNGNDLLASDFDFINEKRLITSHGNNGTFNFKLLEKIPNAGFAYMVQGVDNSLHGKPICHGGNSGGCVVPEPEVIFACTSEEVELTGEPNTLWFSFSEGFLGEKSTLDYQPAQNDTVFSFTPVQGGGCDKLGLYRIEIRDEVKKDPVVKKYACEGSAINLSVESQWTSVAWSSQLRGSLGSSQSISYTVQQPDSIHVLLGNDKGCSIKRTTAVMLSKPVVIVDPENYKVLKGTEVQLNASGAQRYEWSPATGLSDSRIANPTAVPAQTTRYVVTGYDSLDCSDTAEVTVIVEGTGFIPNLFTPNGDGKNDQLKIYGLTATSDFTFSIFNREGSVVFRTRDVDEALNMGWDGTSRGVKQPPGVYYWKVKGSQGSGGKLLLNGKESGSIVLVR